MTDPAVRTFLDELVASGALPRVHADRLAGWGQGFDVEAMVRGVGVTDEAILHAAAVAWGLPPSPAWALDPDVATTTRDALLGLGVPLDRDLWLRLHAAPTVVHGHVLIAWARAASAATALPFTIPYRSALCLPRRVSAFRDALCLLPPKPMSVPRRPSRTLQDPLQSGRWLVLEPAAVADPEPLPAPWPGGEADFGDVLAPASPLVPPPPPPPPTATAARMPAVDLAAPPRLAPPPVSSPPPGPAPATKMPAADLAHTALSPISPIVEIPAAGAPPPSPLSPPPPDFAVRRRPPGAPAAVVPAPPAASNASTAEPVAPSAPAPPTPGPTTTGRSRLPSPVGAPRSEAADRTTVVTTGRIRLADMRPPTPASDTAPATTSMAVLVGRPVAQAAPPAPAPPVMGLAPAKGSANRAVLAALREEPVEDSGPAIGDWAVERPIGSGASADVYLAVRRGQRAALKLLRIDQATATEQLARFEREGNVVARLTHVNVVRLFDRGVTDGTPWLACEYVDGGSVAELMARTGPMPVVVAARIIRDVLRGLSSAHHEGIVHRDLKPGNLLLTRAGVCKVADFGIAKADDNLTLTQEGVAYGTPAYMSPEQASGLPLDHRSDLFGVGTIFWQLLTGQNPFTARTIPGTLVAVSRAAPGDLLDVAPWVPVGVARVVEGLLARLPEDRFQNADAALEALQPLIDWIELNAPQVIPRTLAAPADVAAQLRREQAELEERCARAALSRRPPMRQEAALARRRGLLLRPDADVAATLKELCLQHRYHLDAPRLDELPDVVKAVTRQEESPALLRRAGLAHFDAGNLVEASFYLRRFLALGGTADEAVASRHRALFGATPFAPFEVNRAQRGDDVSTPPQEPTERLDRHHAPSLPPAGLSSPSSSPASSSSLPAPAPRATPATHPTGLGLAPAPLAASPSRPSIPVSAIAAGAVIAGLLGGVLIGQRNPAPAPPPPTSVVRPAAVELGRHLRDARGAARRGDVGGALSLLEVIQREAPAAAEAAEAAALAGELYAQNGNLVQARRAWTFVLAHPQASSVDEQTARAGLASLP